MAGEGRLSWGLRHGWAEIPQLGQGSFVVTLRGNKRMRKAGRQEQQAGNGWRVCCCFPYCFFWSLYGLSRPLNGGAGFSARCLSRTEIQVKKLATESSGPFWNCFSILANGQAQIRPLT